jgi:transcriptional regulator GlxA family with amidase domain
MDTAGSEHREHTVVFVAFDELQLLDLTGPHDVLYAATRLSADPPYRSLIATKGGRPVRSESGLQLSADVSLSELARSRRRIDTLVVVGGAGSRRAAEDAELVADVAVLARRAGRVTSVCSGAFVLAAAGVLDGRRATPHWAFCESLARRYPAVEVLGDQLFVSNDDGDLWTSAGVTAGIDLFLALVEVDHGPELAHTVAGWLVVFVQRPGGQAQFSAQLMAQPARTPALTQLLRWLPDHIDADLSVSALARRAAMSPRSFARAFRAEVGTTPAAHVEALRVEAARRLLETSDLTVETVAVTVGLQRVETLYRAFRRRVGTTPAQYRQHFARRAS